MVLQLPHLSFIPSHYLIFHEKHDEQRTLPLVKRIQASGVWRNPPIVAPLDDGTLRYMVLDGANRITACQKMGFPHALVQIVQPDDPGLGLQTWNHVIWELNARRFLVDIRGIPGIRVVPDHNENSEPSLMGDCGLALVVSCRGRAYKVCTSPGEIVQRVAVLNALVDSYIDHCRLDRTLGRDVHALREIYPRLCGLVIFPNFEVQDLLRLAGDGYLLPTGITRFTISPRALHLNYPLEELASDRSIEDKNAGLEKWIQERLARKGVRYYAEATVLFDE